MSALLPADGPIVIDPLWWQRHPLPGDARASDCEVCYGRRWLIQAPDGDESRVWVEACDSCSSPETAAGGIWLDDWQAATLAAGFLGATVAEAAPDGHDHPHPYVTGLAFAEACRLAGLPYGDTETSLREVRR